MIVVIDNYDSFTYNLVQMIGALGVEVRVFRNDRVDPGGILDLKPRALVISPGPGVPKDAGVSERAIAALYDRLPILGVCLGHQALGEVFGGRIVRSKSLMHGKTSPVTHNGAGLYRGLLNPFVATRYHSLIVEEKTIRSPLTIEARADDGEVMGIRHRDHPVFGVQFHPESVLTEAGPRLLRNFLDLAAARRTA